MWKLMQNLPTLLVKLVQEPSKLYWVEDIKITSLPTLSHLWQHSTRIKFQWIPHSLISFTNLIGMKFLANFSMQGESSVHLQSSNMLLAMTWTLSLLRSWIRFNISRNLNSFNRSSTSVRVSPLLYLMLNKIRTVWLGQTIWLLLSQYIKSWNASMIYSTR